MKAEEGRSTTGAPSPVISKASTTRTDFIRRLVTSARRVQKHKRVAKPLMAELSMIMIDELGDGPARGS